MESFLSHRRCSSPQRKSSVVLFVLFFSALPLSSSAPSFTLCIGGLQLRLAQTSSHMCTHQSCYTQQPQSTVVNTAAHQVTLCCSDLCLRCVCDRWRERGLPFWSGSRQTHENGPYSKFRTGITTFFLYTVLDKCETSTFSRLHTCSSNFVMLCPWLADITCFL